MSTLQIDLRRQRVAKALDFYGGRCERLAARGAAAKHVRAELEQLAYRAGLLALSGGLDLGEIRGPLLEIASRSGVFHAETAVSRGLRHAGKKIAKDQGARERTEEHT